MNVEVKTVGSQGQAGELLQAKARAPGKKPRKVFGRREAVVDQKTMRFEMRANGVHLWRKHSPKKKLVTWTDLVHVAEGQGLLRLNG